MRKITKKYVVIGLIILLVCASVYVVASTFITNNGEEALTETQIEDRERKEKIDEVINVENVDEMSKYETFLLAIEGIVDSPVEFNLIVYNYEYLKVAYNLSDEEMDYLYQLVIDGKNPKDIVSICYFWFDTNEDITIIEDIYDVKWRYKTETWIENAFNYVTENKCGVLETEDVNEYIRKGLTEADIVSANILCRKGVLTIQEILDMRLKGASFAEISAVTNKVPVESLPSEIIAQDKVQVYDIKDEDKALNEMKGNDIIMAEELSRLTKEPISTYYEMIADGEDIEEILDRREEEISEQIEEDLRNRNIYKETTREERQEYIERRKRNEQN